MKEKKNIYKTNLFFENDSSECQQLDSYSFWFQCNRPVKPTPIDLFGFLCCCCCCYFVFIGKFIACHTHTFMLINFIFSFLLFVRYVWLHIIFAMLCLSPVFFLYFFFYCLKETEIGQMQICISKWLKEIFYFFIHSQYQPINGLHFSCKFPFQLIMS